MLANTDSGPESPSSQEDNFGPDLTAQGDFAAFHMHPSVQQPPSVPVELQVTNLDQTISQRDMKKVILGIFKPHVNVLNVSVFFQSDGNMACSVKVGSLAEAQYAISKLHRTKVGYKRILISFNQPNTGPNPHILKSQVFALLSDVPGGKLQLFNFREMFEKRYHSSIGVSDLYKMKDVVLITDEDTGRMVTLLSPPTGKSERAHYSSLPFHMHGGHYGSGFGYPCGLRGTPFPPEPGFMGYGKPSNDKKLQDAQKALQLEDPICTKHAQSGREREGWAERDNGTSLPLVYTSLADLAIKIKSTIKSHNGSVPLASIMHCIKAEADVGEPLVEDNEDGVPLEHLITCIKGVTIQPGVTGVKAVVLNDDEQSSTYPSHIHPAAVAAAAAPLGSGEQFQFSQFNGSMAGGGGGMHHMPLSPLAKQLAFFSRELVDLLKTQPGCVMLFNKFIPSYHHHFGRQCRAADYGYTKLRDLFKALPHVIQMMGEGSRSKITLAHRAQIKRFTSDLLKLLKSQSSKQISLVDLPQVYEKVHGRIFKVNDYGVCEVEDLLHEISETAVVVSGSGDDLTIAIPKREQTLDEVVRTHTFGEECLELLKHAPNCRLPFNKFIPSYHHHFGRQCRVADYGFAKLIELFEAVPNIVEITEDVYGERIVQLTEAEMLIVAADQISSVVQDACSMLKMHDYAGMQAPSIAMNSLEELYKSKFGYELVPERFGKNDLMDLLKSLGSTLRLEGSGSSAIIRLIDRSKLKELASKVRDVLLTNPEAKMNTDEFIALYQNRHNVLLDLDQLAKDLPELVEINGSKKEGNPSAEDEKACNNSGSNSMNISSSSAQVSESCSSQLELCVTAESSSPSKSTMTIRLVPIQLCAARIEQLVKEYNGRIKCSELEAVFVNKFSTPLCPGQFGFPSVNMLIQAGLNKHFSIRGRGSRKYITLVKDLSDLGFIDNHQRFSNEVLQKHSSLGGNRIGLYPRSAESLSMSSLPGSEQRSGQQLGETGNGCCYRSSCQSSRCGSPCSNISSTAHTVQSKQGHSLTSGEYYGRPTAGPRMGSSRSNQYRRGNFYGGGGHHDHPVGDHFGGSFGFPPKSKPMFTPLREGLQGNMYGMYDPYNRWSSMGNNLSSGGGFMTPLSVSAYSQRHMHSAQGHHHPGHAFSDSSINFGFVPYIGQGGHKASHIHSPATPIPQLVTDSNGGAAVLNSAAGGGSTTPLSHSPVVGSPIGPMNSSEHHHPHPFGQLLAPAAAGGAGSGHYPVVPSPVALSTCHASPAADCPAELSLKNNNTNANMWNQHFHF